MLAGRNQIGPDLGLHQDTDIWPELLHKPPHRARAIPGQPHLCVTGLQQPRALGAARGGAVGQQQPHAGQGLTQEYDQQRGGAGLTQRHRMHPDSGPRRSRPGAGVFAKALRHRLCVQGFCQGPARELAPQTGLRQDHQERVEPAHQVGTTTGLTTGHTICQACQTWSTVGLGVPSTLHCSGPGAGPVRQAVSKL